MLLIGCKGKIFKNLFFFIKSECRREGIECRRVVIEPHSTGVDVFRFSKALIEHFIVLSDVYSALCTFLYYMSSTFYIFAYALIKFCFVLKEFSELSPGWDALNGLYLDSKVLIFQ